MLNCEWEKHIGKTFLAEIAHWWALYINEYLYIDIHMNILKYINIIIVIVTKKSWQTLKGSIEEVDRCVIAVEGGRLD